METETKETITFSLRISGDLDGKIRAEAERQKRTRQAQIEFTLEEIFNEKKNGNAKRGTRK